MDWSRGDVDQRIALLRADQRAQVQLAENAVTAAEQRIREDADEIDRLLAEVPEQRRA